MMTLSRPLPSPKEFKLSLPSSPKQLALVQNRRAEIAQILSGRSHKRLLVVGPCSIHDLSSAKLYGSLLAELQGRVADQFLLVMRAYFEKPRTATGWKGFLYDPHLNETDDLLTGLHLARQLLLDLAAMGVAAATEFLDPVTPYYYGDLISWGSIGARTASSQIHRQMVSALPIPTGFKNSTKGDVDTAIHAVLAAGISHAFLGLNEEGRAAIVQSTGNANCHVVLRGSARGPNFDESSIDQVLKRLEIMDLPPRVLVDCSHDNCGKNYALQAVAFESVVDQIARGNRKIIGLALESFLDSGNQPFSPGEELSKKISLTDPCLDWNSTEELILAAGKTLAGSLHEVP